MFVVDVVVDVQYVVLVLRVVVLDVQQQLDISSRLWSGLVRVSGPWVGGRKGKWADLVEALVVRMLPRLPCKL